MLDPAESMPTFVDGRQHEIAAGVTAGMAIDEIEDRLIAPAPLPEDQQAALWLYGWALEQHVDEVARRIGIDGLELRRRNIVRTGDEGPSGQLFEEIGLEECLEQAAAMAGYGADLPDDEEIGIAVGWWPSFPGASGAYVKLNADGSGVIVTGAQECGTGAVMAGAAVAVATR